MVVKGIHRPGTQGLARSSSFWSPDSSNLTWPLFSLAQIIKCAIFFKTLFTTVPALHHPKTTTKHCTACILSSHLDYQTHAGPVTIAGHVEHRSRAFDETAPPHWEITQRWDLMVLRLSSSQKPTPDPQPWPPATPPILQYLSLVICQTPHTDLITLQFGTADYTLLGSRQSSFSNFTWQQIAGLLQGIKGRVCVRIQPRDLDKTSAKYQHSALTHRLHLTKNWRK